MNVRKKKRCVDGFGGKASGKGATSDSRETITMKKSVSVMPY